MRTQAQKEYQAAWQREKRLRDPEAVRSAQRAKYERNRESVLAAVKAYGDANADRIAERKRAKYRSWDPEARREASLRRLYGIGVDEFNRMAAVQGGLCAICGVQDRLCVDHCHTSGALRGLLCGKCNKAIGLFDEVPDRMQRAMAYLGKYAPKKS